MDLRDAHLEAQGAVDEAHDAGPSTNVPKRSGAVRVPQTSRPLFPPLMPGIVKGAIVATPEQETPAEDALPRDSWMSLESRSSVVPSVLSRFSTLSALTRYSVRQSSIESPISAISELSPEQCKDNFGCDHRYCCTFCDLSFELKEEWKLHELESHDRHEVFSCGECQDVFTRAVSLEHHQRHEHSIEPNPDIPHQAKRVPIRSFWGCGFCAAPALFSSRPDYLEHVGKHYDEGRERSEWQHTLVITALLSQPKVKGAWDTLVKEQELASGEKIRFAWDSSSTGRVGSDVREPSSLQDILEFFATGPMGPQQVAELAFARAQKQVRADVGVSGAHSKDFRRNSEELKPVTTLPFSSENPSTLRDLRQDEDDENEVTPPIETPSLLISQPFLPHSHRPSSNQPSSQQPSPEQVSSKSAFFLHASTREMGRDSPSSKVLARIGQSTARSSSVPAAPSRADRRLDSGSSFQHRMKQGVLRRTDSDRNLATFNQNRDLGGDDIPRPQSQLSIRSRNVPSVAVEGSSGVNNADLITAASTGPQSSVRPHTSSSTLSSHDRDGSRWLDDSTSEAVSDDSLSDTDSWLEFDGQSVATKAWKVAFRGRVQEGMGLLWARYNGEFDTLIRQCVGGERSSGSPQFRESSGRARRGTTSRHGHGHGKNLRPNGRYPEDDEDDEEDGEGHRPASSLSKRSSVSAKQFACPFRKHDPQKYSLQTHEVCAIRSWPTISRLKEHLYRRHYKVHCPRCKLTFNDARELADHEMYLQGCEVTNAPTPGDIDAWKERQLKSRRHNARRKTDEEKWREIYELLFPHEEIPSPYPEAAEDLVSVPSETHSSLDFQHFLLTQIPRLFTQTAEEHAGNYIQVHGSLPMDSIPEILESSLRKAFQAWEARGNELEAREASIASRSFLSNASPPLPYIFAQSTAAPVTAAYQTPPMSASVDQQFLLGNMTHNHMSAFSPSVTQANDSGFDETNFSGFSMGPGDYSGFVPQYNTDNWETGLGLMNSNNMTYDDNPHLTNQFQGYHQG